MENKIIDKNEVRRLHNEIVENIKKILNEEILEDGDDILLQNSADQIGISKKLLIDILGKETL